MVVVGSVCEQQVGCFAADQADQVGAVVEGGFESAVGMVEHQVADPQRGTGRVGFLAANLGQLVGGDFVMSGPAIGHADKRDRVPQLSPECGGAAGRQVAIVWMGPDDQDLQWLAHAYPMVSEVVSEALESVTFNAVGRVSQTRSVSGPRGSVYNWSSRVLG